MPMFEPASPPRLILPALPSTLGLTQKLAVIPSLTNPRAYTLAWHPILGVVKYVVYVSPSPANKNKCEEVLPSVTQIQFEVPLVVPDDVTFYFWVGYINAHGTVTMIQDEPVYTTNDSAFESSTISTEMKRDIFTDDDMKFYVEEIRRRLLTMLQNDGEEFDLYIRRMYGQSCVCLEKEGATPGGRVDPKHTGYAEELGEDFEKYATPEAETNESKDPEYQSSYRCTDCFGTGIAGGYYPKIRMTMRYGDLPTRSIKLGAQGIEFSHDFNSVTIWHPKIKERDVFVRRRTGERFFAKSVGQTEWRGMPLHQAMTLVGEPRNGMLYQITDDKIQKALEEEGAWGIGKWNWALWK